MNFRFINKNFKLFFFFFSTQTITLISSKSILECDYDITSDLVYTCEVQDFQIFNNSNLNITGADGPHLPEFSDNTVGGVSIFMAQNLKTFPSGIDNVFKNLYLIRIESCKLKEIHQNDLKVFPKLEILYLRDNQLEFLEANLFEFNLKLQKIWVDHNPLKEIDPMIFSNLPSLESLRIGKCEEMNENFANASDRTQVLDLVKKIESGVCHKKGIEVTTQVTDVPKNNETTTVIIEQETTNENIIKINQSSRINLNILLIGFTLIFCVIN
ncbi:hypothetical protein PVAND_015851 [Polypedilum vanderplanki]|uniref:Uncharacterized protein n=1 Tax=Polypedilum vanderplanki TaxID=319348 RepID=A0A9J6BDR4_POLVA|nr:hypothetical protein PVAND_015851 [Polypedilum vanderplanki]